MDIIYIIRVSYIYYTCIIHILYMYYTYILHILTYIIHVLYTYYYTYIIHIYMWNLPCLVWYLLFFWTNPELTMKNSPGRCLSGILWWFRRARRHLCWDLGMKEWQHWTMFCKKWKHGTYLLVIERSYGKWTIYRPFMMIYLLIDDTI